MHLPNSPLALTTRRQFLGRCTAGLALAHGARLFGQSAQKIKWAGLRIPTRKFSPAEGYTLDFSVILGTSTVCSFIFGEPISGTRRVMPEVKTDFMPLDGPLKIAFRAWHHTNPQLWANLKIPDMQMDRSYTADVKSTAGSVLKATFVARVAEVNYKNTSNSVLQIVVDQL